MSKKHLLPLALFCIVFLLYTIYFVKVINTPRRLEPNSIAKTIKRVLQEKETQPVFVPTPEAPAPEMKALPEKTPEAPPPETPKVPNIHYVNFAWLNVRKEPSLTSPILEKIYKNDEVDSLFSPNPKWVQVKTKSGTIGYVAEKYLSNEPQKIPSATPPQYFDIPIILYHRIDDDIGKFPENLTLPVVNFIAQLDYLIGHGLKTYTFQDLSLMKDGKMKIEKGVILTFDDGYDNAYQTAQNLNGKGLKGVFFIITDKVGTNGYLTWREIKKMRSWGMEIGSHGVKSADLVASTDYFIADELERSKKIIEEQLGEKIISFAYPSGRYNGKVLETAKKAGYLFARGIESGSRYAEKQFLKLPTLRVYPPAGAKQFKVWLE